MFYRDCEVIVAQISVHIACGCHDLASVCMFIKLYEARTAYAGMIFLVKDSDCAEVRSVIPLLRKRDRSCRAIHL